MYCITVVMMKRFQMRTFWPSFHPNFWALLICLLGLVLPTSARDHRRITEAAVLHKRNDLIKRGRAVHSSMHECVFSVKMRNLDLLDAILLDVSLPNSPNYGKHKTREELAELTANPEATAAVVDYLTKRNIKILQKSTYGEKITALAPVSTWESIFSTQFFHFDRMDRNGDSMPSVARALEYTIPEELEQYVEHVFNTVQMPVTVATPMDATALAATNPHSWVNPTFLREYYNVDRDGGPLSSQLVYAYKDQNFSPEDLSLFFFFFFGTTSGDKIDKVIGGHNSSTICVSNPDTCVEANLDVQYILGVGPYINTTFYYDTSSDFLLTWSQRMVDDPNRPMVTSISYGAEESQFTLSTVNTFDVNMKLMGAMGLTVLAGSGDDGVGGNGARDNPSGCGYNPIWPTTSPYVLSIGGTQGPESNSPEIVCSADTGGIITTGGGFSNLYPRPFWQESAVQGYFAKVSGTANDPISGYNTTGRGYPDISVMAYSYYTIVGREPRLQSGTSAATPVVAAMLSIINSERKKLGRSGLGWVNPSIYHNYSIFNKDITSGNNKCAAGNNPSTVTCCSQGFYATEGWDPLTGFGSFDFYYMRGYLMSLGYEYTPSPTHAPTSTPTSQPSAPTFEPTRRPTPFPTTRPPTRSPTWRPTLATPAPTPAISSDSSQPSIVFVAIVVGAIAGGLLVICAICYYCNYFASMEKGSSASGSSEKSGSSYESDDSEMIYAVVDDSQYVQDAHLDKVYDDFEDFGDLELMTYSHLASKAADDEDDDGLEAALKESALMNSDFYSGDFGQPEDEIYKLKFGEGRLLIPDEDEDAANAALFSADAVEGQDDNSGDADRKSESSGSSSASSYASDEGNGGGRKRASTDDGSASSFSGSEENGGDEESRGSLGS